jgi:hypothetical protein
MCEREIKCPKNDLPFMYADVALPAAASRHVAYRSKLCLEHFGNQLVGGCCSQEPEEFLWSITSIHLQGEETAIFAADRCCRSL